MALSFAHGNVKNSMLGVRQLMKDSPDCVSINETSRLVRPIAKVKRYLDVHGVNAEDMRRGPKGVVAMQLKKHNSFGQFAFFGAAPSTPHKLAPERWFSAVAFDHPQFGPVCMTSLHPHAAVKNKDDSVDRVEKFSQQMSRLDSWLTFCEMMGYYCLVMGDVQLTPRSEFDGLSPYEVFDKHNMQHKNVHIDALAFHKRNNGKRVRIRDFDVISKELLRSDHRGFRGSLVM